MSPTHPLLEGLDAAQAEAASALVGPVRIVAGAGTGKTRAITRRIAYGIATGAYAPERIMALTFTTRAAGQLRSRLRELGAGTIHARTFHAAALSQLSFFWPRVVGGPAPRVLGGKARLLGHAAERVRLDVDVSTLREVAAEIEWRKVAELSLYDYAATARRVAALDTDAVVMLQQAYEDLKDERRYIDFEDVLLACAGMIEAEPQVALHVREQYRFFVVDEYQDVSPLQQRLLELWLGNRRELCVVGDPSQTIYSFAGARNDYLLDFHRRYPDATTVRLDTNYRSSPAIIDVANRVISSGRGAIRLRAAREFEAPTPRVSVYETVADEAERVSDSIASLIAGGRAAASIAVLFRTSAQGEAVAQALGHRGVSTALQGGPRFFDRPEVRQAVMAIRAASLAATSQPLFHEVSDVLRSLGWSQNPPESSGAAREKWESLNALMLLVDAAPPGTTLKQFADDLAERQQYVHEPSRDAVTLATLHATKGLEWQTVFIIGVSEGVLPISYARTDDELAEERRLFYVGVTRAQHQLELSWSRSSARSAPAAASRFLEAIHTDTEGETPPPPDTSSPSRR